jgi:UDP-N-acetylmuramoyl-tripeptide--D-alanyl-D-alanine ligase
VARAGRLCAVKAPSGAWVIDDSYNANPASGRSSIETASEIAADLERRLVLVLGEMRELGGESAREHDLLGLAAASSGAALVVAVAGDAQLVAERAREQGIEAHFAADAHAAAELALRHVRAGDVVLVKGSRGVRTELVVKVLMDADSDVPNGGASPRDSCRGALR